MYHMKLNKVALCGKYCLRWIGRGDCCLNAFVFVYSYTFLDSAANGGRTVLILKAKNIVEDHDKKVIISYNFPKNKIIVEPLMLVGSFFVFFVLLSIFARGKVVKSEVKKE